jgi:hypothetical protein
MVKQNKLPTAECILFVAGFISVTLIAAFIANGFFAGHAMLLLVEVILYLAIATIYIQTFRTSRTNTLVQLARVISYAGIITAILIASFIIYFVSTFRW